MAIVNPFNLKGKTSRLHSLSRSNCADVVGSETIVFLVGNVQSLVRLSNLCRGFPFQSVFYLDDNVLVLGKACFVAALKKQQKIFNLDFV